MLTFRDLQLRVLRWIDEANSTSTTLALVKDALNQAQRRLVGLQDWRFAIWPREEALSTANGVRTQALSASCGKLLYVWDTIAHDFVPFIGRSQWQSEGIDRTNGADRPNGFTFGPVWPVAAQPLGVAATLVSSNGADTTPTITLRGFLANGEEVTETLTANGTTPVSGTTLFQHILDTSKGGTWLGTLTLTAGATTLLSLGAADYGKQYPTIEWTETPSRVVPYTYRFQRVVPPMVNDNDMPILYPNHLAEILCWDTLFDLTTYNTELGLKEQAVWRPKRDELFNALLDSNSGDMIGSHPRTVRDVLPTF